MGEWFRRRRLPSLGHFLRILRCWLLSDRQRRLRQWRFRNRCGGKPRVSALRALQSPDRSLYGLLRLTQRHAVQQPDHLRCVLRSHPTAVVGQPNRLDRAVGSDLYRHRSGRVRHRRAPLTERKGK